jgi:hypothetical protein
MAGATRHRESMPTRERTDRSTVLVTEPLSILAGTDVLDPVLFEPETPIELVIGLPSTSLRKRPFPLTRSPQKNFAPPASADEARFGPSE